MKNVGRYKPLRQIATGGMADIFVAEQRGARGFRKRVVLKKIRPEFAANQHFLNMLVDEAHIAMGFNHSNLVQVLDFGQASKSYYLVLELVDGWSLDQLIRRSRSAKVPIPPPLALYVIAEVCRGLAYAHGFIRDGKPLGIVHRDVSPHNVLLSAQGEVKLADFGIALAFEKLEQTATGVVKGKLAFFSPEQSQAQAIDARSDLFSLGIVLYYLLADALPFQAPTGLETVLKIRAGDFVPLSKARPQLDAKVAKLVAKALKTKPEERFQSADEMLVAVEGALRAAFPPTGRTELERWLSALTAKDGVPSVGSDRNEDASTKQPPAEEIELISDSAIVPPTLPPKKAAPPPMPPVLVEELRPADVLEPPPPPPRRARWPWVAGVLLLGGAGAAVGLREDLRPHLSALRAFREATPGLADAGAPVATALPPQLLEPAPPLGIALPEAVDASAAAPDAGAEELPDAGAVAIFDDAGDALVEVVPDPDPPTAPPMVEAPATPEPPPATAPAPKRSEPAPARKVEKGKVVVKVTSSPAGAAVKVEGRELGRTPVSLKFRANILFELTFEKEGYLPSTRRFYITDKPDQRVGALLRRAPGDAPRASPPPAAAPARSR